MQYANVKTIESLKEEVSRLLNILASKVNDDCYPRNPNNDIMQFSALELWPEYQDKWTPVTFEFPIGDGTPCIQKTDGRENFLYIVSEVIEQEKTEYSQLEGDAEDVLFLLFDSLTLSMAQNWEAINRIGCIDSNRLILSKQVELLSYLNLEWAKIKYNSLQRTFFVDPPLEFPLEKDFSPSFSVTFVPLISIKDIK